MALSFKLLGTPVAIGLDFFVAAVGFGLFWHTPEELPVWVAVMTGSVLLHELAHAAVFEAVGSPASIRLMFAGGLTRAMQPTTRQHVLVAFAGPGVGILVGGFVGLLMVASPRLAGVQVAQDLVFVNLGWGLFNLLPLPGLDGDWVVRQLTTVILGRPADLVGRLVGVAILAAATVGLFAARYVDAAIMVGLASGLTFVRFGIVSDVLVGRSHPVSSIDLLSKGRYREAWETARREMAAHPDDREPILAASDALRMMTRWTDADWGYSRVLEADAHNPRALRGRAATRRNLGRRPEAETDLAALLALPAPEAGIYRIIALGDAQRFGDALALCRTPDQPTAVHARTARDLGALYEWLLGREAEALRSVESAIGDSPGRGDLHDLRARILADLGRLAEARAAVNRALAEAPLHPDYHMTLGIVERLDGHAEAGLEHLVMAAVSIPEDPEARAEVALCFAQLGRIEQARTGLSTLPPWALEQPLVEYARAGIAATSGNAEEAIALLRRAARARPELAFRASVDPLLRRCLPADELSRLRLPAAVPPEPSATPSLGA